jgi:hypothetical protein
MKEILRKIIYSINNPKRVAVLDYPIELKPLYTPETKPHQQLFSDISKGNENYNQLLQQSVQYRAAFEQLPLTAADPKLPAWQNDFFRSLDTIVLYTILATHKPQRYVEIGSGNSTKLAHYCRQHESLRYTITCIDPYPRAEIKAIADNWEERPVQSVSSNVFRNLQPGDVVFFDGSHVLHPNSDVMWFFLEVLPVIPKGVVIHIHDIFLPYDYPQWECDHFFSEQYMLAACLLNSTQYEVLAPVYYMMKNGIGRQHINDLWTLPVLQSVQQWGQSFWFVKK